jgi:hypothetical protein
MEINLNSGLLHLQMCGDEYDNLRIQYYCFNLQIISHAHELFLN